jgi:glutaredoxin
MRNKKTFFVVILIIVIIMAVLVAIFWPKNASQPSSQALQSDIILYVSDICQHCKNVEKFIEDNKVADKVPFQTEEVSTDTKNAQDLMLKAGKCGIANDQIGVPLLWDGSTCLLGEDEITNFFKNKAGIN